MQTDEGPHIQINEGFCTNIRLTTKRNIIAFIHSAQVLRSLAPGISISSATMPIM